MEYWAEIVGQTDAVRTLDRAAETGVVAAHAWLITGPPGSGRSNLAFRFAAALIARTAEMRESVFEQVRARTHPDLGVLTTQKLLIDIRAARDIVTTAHYAPAEGRYRVIVIEDADRMPERTSNVLLKALEEPPERTIWILCAPSEADLLPTIRSRARSLRLVTPSPADIAKLLHERDGIDAAAAERAARLAQSHIGMARRLASDEGAMQRRDRSVELALGIATLGDAMRAAAALVKVAEADAAALTEARDLREREDAMRSLGLAPGAAIPPQMRSQMRALEEDQKRRATRSLRDGIDRILTDLLSVYRDILLHALVASDGADGGIDLINREERARIADRAERWGPIRALAAVSAVETARTRLTRGITPALVLEALFAGIIAAEEPV
ncbi:DNA polymerase III delta prime subunit [Leucobacter luti]|uniref:DNA polymerase III subunit delta' n=1 Tax=Leucobacter luti TaxID=340320 RepID=UPI001049C8B7|nr:DNA polymerase III subunit delta' [Leucobacter luti]MCW2289538.1 DNA polymerase-3 subunit delta' [Leucobacter luti]TCK37710.1 DNA polymerase III delta prime subunit [Leucobacter luti]